MNIPATNAAPRPPAGRLLSWSGMGLVTLGVLGYLVQIGAKVLVMPWYMPVLGTLGALLILLALFRERSKGRVFAFVVFGLLAAFQWFLLTSFSRLPVYAGPVVEGQPFPTFTATLADGSPFLQEDLKGDRNTVLVFFRGRW